jgi:heat shock protein HtpX
MKNHLKTLLLLATLSSLLVLFCRWAFGGVGGATIGLVIALVMNLGAYWFSDKLALKMSGARPVSENEAPELYAMVRGLADDAGLPMPSLHMIPTDQPNAFATGRNPEHAAVAVTEGIMKILTPEELEGVLAHELSHIGNRDILITTIAAAIAGAISWIGTMARWGAMFGGGDDDESPLGFVGVFVASIIASLAALIIQLAISRSREYHADETGALLSGKPHNLASALEKIDHYAKQIPMRVNPSAAPLFIMNPLTGGLGRGMAALFSTHPPTEERIRRLESIRV